MGHPVLGSSAGDPGVYAGKNILCEFKPREHDLVAEGVTPYWYLVRSCTPFSRRYHGAKLSWMEGCMWVLELHMFKPADAPYLTDEQAEARTDLFVSVSRELKSGDWINAKKRILRPNEIVTT